MAEPATDPTDGFEPIAIVYSMPEATVLLATLRAYGIFALARNQQHISAAPSLMLALGGVRIMVPPMQLDDALALMKEIDRGWRIPRPMTVPARWLSRIVSVAMTVILGVPPMPRGPGFYRWESAPPPRIAAHRPRSEGTPA
ncbi:MAG: hypothetical protein QOH81_1903 [Sphingomonadales bacterium]|nr:hypothetical protein [Sphingomonadales bacterium]